MAVDRDEVVPADMPQADRVERLSLLYGEVCSAWRELIGVRFKLLGFVPAISGVAVGLLLRDGRLAPGLGAGIASFGLLVTFGIFLYDQRNSQLHDELVSRGRRIEAELGIVVGMFRGRPGSRGIVKHDYATTLVYVATLAAWLGAGIALAV
jgi:hypothetical protein